jgi:hypothetical protein
MARTSGKERARARILTDDEIRALLRAVEAKPGPFGAFVTFLLLTGARKSEAAQMPWDEIKDGVWLLPAARNKVKQDLARPLSGATQKLVDGLPKLGRYVFTFDGEKPISSFSNLKARLDARLWCDRLDPARPAAHRTLPAEPGRESDGGLPRIHSKGIEAWKIYSAVKTTAIARLLMISRSIFLNTCVPAALGCCRRSCPTAQSRR